MKMPLNQGHYFFWCNFFETFYMFFIGYSKKYIIFAEKSAINNF